MTERSEEPRPGPQSGSPTVDDLDALVTSLTPRITAAVWAYLPDRRDVEDVVQDVWEMFLRNLPAIRDQHGIAGWLRTTAIRHAIRTANRVRRETPTNLLDGLAMAVAADDRVDIDARDAALRRAVAALPERDRVLAALLAHQPQLSYRDLAAHIKVAPNSLGKIRARCLRKLRTTLAAEDITEA